MKRIALLLVPISMIIFSNQADGQTSHFGITAGLNIANVKGIDGATTKNGLIIGAFTSYDFSNLFAIEPQLLFSMKGASGTVPNGPDPNAGSDFKWTLNYVELPILVKVEVISVPVLPVSVAAYAGPDFAFNVASSDKLTLNSQTQTLDEKGNTHPFDFNIAAGVEADLDLSITTLGLGARYTFGTGPVFKTGPNSKNGVWSIMASAAF